MSIQDRIEQHVRLIEQRYGGRCAEDRFRPIIRNQGKNEDVIVAVIALLSTFEDISPFTLAPVLKRVFDLEGAYGINPAPLFNFNTPQNVEAAFDALLGTPIDQIAVRPEELLRALQEICDNHLLGKNTPSKMAYVKAITGSPLRMITPEQLTRKTFSSLIERTLDLLRRRKSRTRRKGDSVADPLRKIEGLAVLHKVASLFSTFCRMADPSGFYRVYSDPIAQILADSVKSLGSHEALCYKALDALHYRRYRGIEFSFTPRDRHFIFSGDWFGDCTAYAMRSQVDTEIANIHWTVYPWLLDPFYRVLDLSYDKANVLKAHLLPLVIQDRPVLMIDAIEVVPSLRAFVRGRANDHVSWDLFARRREFLDALFETCRGIARAMGVEAVYVDKFSNAHWVQEEVDKLPSDGYHRDDVVKPFSDDVIQWNVEQVLGNPPGDILIEVQARNVMLAEDQQRHLRPGYKEVGVLMGRRKNWGIPLRGI